MKLIIAVMVMILSGVNSAASEGDRVKAGDYAPAFSFKNSDGARLSLLRLRGKVVLLTFFSTKSVPSVRELEFIQRFIWQPEHSGGLIILGIGREHDEREVNDFLSTKHLDFTLVADPKREIYGQYATDYIPHSYVVGKDGLIKYASLGFDEWEIDRIKAAVDIELKK